VQHGNPTRYHRQNKLQSLYWQRVVKRASQDVACGIAAVGFDLPARHGGWSLACRYALHLSGSGYQFQLEEALQEQFSADEIHWICGENAGDMLGTSEVDDKAYVILEAWWD
jgi:hypothetical protein